MLCLYVIFFCFVNPKSIFFIHTLSMTTYPIQDCSETVEYPRKHRDGVGNTLDQMLVHSSDCSRTTGTNHTLWPIRPYSPHCLLLNCSWKTEYLEVNFFPLCLIFSLHMLLVGTGILTHPRNFWSMSVLLWITGGTKLPAPSFFERKHFC